MATHNQFTPAGVPTTFAAIGATPTLLTLPPVDGSNPAVLLQNVGVGSVTVFAGVAQPGGTIAGVSGLITLREGEAQLFPNNPGLGAATAATMQGTSSAARLQFTRGSVTPLWLFGAPAAVVI